MLRAEGTPPTASIEPNGAGGGSKTKLRNVTPRAYTLWTSVVSLPWIESTFTNQRIVSTVSAMLASESAPTRIPRASFPLSALA